MGIWMEYWKQRKKKKFSCDGFCFHMHGEFTLVIPEWWDLWVARLKSTGEVMFWLWSDDNSLPQIMMSIFTGAYKHFRASSLPVFACCKEVSAFQLQCWLYNSIMYIISPDCETVTSNERMRMWHIPYGNGVNSNLVSSSWVFVESRFVLIMIAAHTMHMLLIYSQ